MFRGGPGVGQTHYDPGASDSLKRNHGIPHRAYMSLTDIDVKKDVDKVDK